jgi:putative transposase
MPGRAADEGRGFARITREATRKSTLGDGAQTERPADLVERQFVPGAPNQPWVADFKCRRRRLKSATTLDVRRSCSYVGNRLPPDESGVFGCLMTRVINAAGRIDRNQPHASGSDTL